MVVVSSVLQLRAQNAQSEPPAGPAVETVKPQSQTTVTVQTPSQAKPETSRWIDRVKAGGLFQDLRTNTNGFRIFSLRKPIDPKTDFQNVYVDPSTGRTMGIKLLTFSF